MIGEPFQNQGDKFRDNINCGGGGGGGGGGVVFHLTEEMIAAALVRTFLIVQGITEKKHHESDTRNV